MIVSPLCAEGVNEFISHVFEFTWNGAEGMMQILLSQGTILYYSGYGISHRQVSMNGHGNSHVCATSSNCIFGDNQTTFWNLSSYANKRLFDNFMESFRRIRELIFSRKCKE